jgi:hypothetical protein
MTPCQIEFAHTRNAQWSWHCWTCDTNRFNHPSEAEAHDTAAEHEKARGPRPNLDVSQ